MFLAALQKFQVVLAAVKTTNDCPWAVAFGEVAADNTTSAPLNGVGNTNGTTAVDVIAAPAGALIRELLHFEMTNADTAPVTVKIRFNNNGTTFDIQVFTLQVGDNLSYDISGGWKQLTGGATLVTAGRYTIATVTVSAGGLVTAIDRGFGSAYANSLGYAMP